VLIISPYVASRSPDLPTPGLSALGVGVYSLHPTVFGVPTLVYGTGTVLETFPATFILRLLDQGQQFTSVEDNGGTHLCLLHRG
jgi:hypothetical protein